MIDDKRQRALSSQIGHDLSRDLTPIARGVIAADNIQPAAQCLSAFATLARSCGKDFRLQKYCGTAPSGSLFISLMVESGLRPAFSFTSLWNEHMPEASTTRPSRRKISIERAETWLHLTFGGSPARRVSVTVTSTPREASSIASVSPTGPAPTINTL